MRILLATAHPYIPQIAGGAQSSTHELACELRQHGHEVGVVCGLIGAGLLAYRNRVLMKVLRKETIKDHALGYPVFRSWFAWNTLAEAVREFDSDVVFAQSGFPARMAKAAQDLGIPVVVYLRNVEEDDLGGELSELDGVHYIANSQFTARKFRETEGIVATVIHPLLDRQQYETSLTRQNVTFINPHPHKGAALALDIAEMCSDIPFAFIECWTLDDGMRRELTARISNLPNVTLKPRTRKMNEIYRDARVVLVPSRWEEAFGRVAAEAQFSGIPVVASSRGGLPEAVGPGGVLIDPGAPATEWVAAIRRLWEDEEHWRFVSEAARRHANRPALDRNRQIDAVLSVLSAAVGSGRSVDLRCGEPQNMVRESV
jgi:glycosyltransferase involved in cell wall biosynthesis